VAQAGIAPRRGVARHRSREIHLTVPRRYRRRASRPADGVRLHTTTVPLRRDEVVQRFNVELTSPARTIVDVADAGVDPSVVVEATARALSTGLLTPAELREAVKDRSARVRRLLEPAIKEAGSRA
jgi:predicted transcriptional regulator of viral defense system